MSYINEALRKAQRERGNRYEKFGGILATDSGWTDRPRKRRSLLFVAALIILAVALLTAVQALRNFSPAGKAEPSAVSGEPTSKAAAKPAPKTMETMGPDKGGVLAETPGKAAQGVPASLAAAVRPSGGTPSDKELEALYGEASLAQRKGDFPRAEALYQRVLSLNAGHVRALNNLGVLYMTQKMREKAVAVLGQAIALKKDYVDPYYNLACLYAQANELRESLRYLKIAATIDGNVIDWAKKDADMKNVAASPEFKKIMEGQKN